MTQPPKTPKTPKTKDPLWAIAEASSGATFELPDHITIAYELLGETQGLPLWTRTLSYRGREVIRQYGLELPDGPFGCLNELLGLL